MLERACLFHCSLPEPQTAVQACTRTARGELGFAGKEFVILIEQFLAEGIADVPVVVEATVQTLYVLRRHHVQEVLVEVRADQVSAALREARLVKLLEEGCDPGRYDRIEDYLCAAGRDLVNSLAIVGVVEGKVLPPTIAPPFAVAT